MFGGRARWRQDGACVISRCHLVTRLRPRLSAPPRLGRGEQSGGQRLGRDRLKHRAQRRDGLVGADDLEHLGRASPAETVLAEWRASDRFGAPGSQAEHACIALLFGPGGIYTVQELERRNAMLDLLEASIVLMSEELRILVIALADRLSPGASADER